MNSATSPSASVIRVAPSSQTVWQSQTSRSPLASPRPRLPGEPLGRRQRLRRQRLGDPVAIAALGLEVGAHVAVASSPTPQCGSIRAGAPRRRAGGDRMALVGDEPAGAVGGREGVVGAGEDGLVERQVAELARAVAAIPRPRCRRGPGRRRCRGPRAAPPRPRSPRARDRQAADRAGCACDRSRPWTAARAAAAGAAARRCRRRPARRRRAARRSAGPSRSRATRKAPRATRADPAAGPAGPRPWPLEQPPQARRG